MIRAEQCKAAFCAPAQCEGLTASLGACSVSFVAPPCVPVRLVGAALRVLAYQLVLFRGGVARGNRPLRGHSQADCDDDAVIERSSGPLNFDHPQAISAADSPWE